MKIEPKLINLLIFLIIVASCENKPAHPSLWTFGNQKKKFQKVLDYYSEPEDSLKFRAAEFLIENMDEHFYYQADNEVELDEFFLNISSKVSVSDLCNTRLKVALRRELMDIAISKSLSDGSLSKPKYRKRSDIKTIEPEYLIENIEYAFKAWKFPWAQAYSFENFCRYILPYRYGREVPESRRKITYQQYKWITDSVGNTKNPLEVASYLNKQFYNVLSHSRKITDSGIRMKLSNQIDAMVYGNCVEQAGLGVSALRSIGIPATMVSIPQYGRLSSGHELTGILDSEGNWHYIGLGDEGIKNHSTSLINDFPKMFFKRFDNMKHHKPVLEDASDQLMNGIDLEVKVNAEKDDEIYLCVFGNKNEPWIPVFKGKNMKSKVFFKNVGNGKVMYVAAIKSAGKLKAVSNVFSPDRSGNITYYKPDNTKLYSTFLTRKYPDFNKAKRRLSSLQGGEFSISDDKDFTNRTILYSIDSTLKYDYNIIQCSTKTGKYFQYSFPQTLDSIFDGPAEISFYTSSEKGLKKIEGKYFGSPQLSQEHIKLMTDDDMLTYVEVWDCLENLQKDTGRFILRKDRQPIWVGMELDTPATVTHVGICSRNDRNGVYPGMNYELFYWDDSWKSLGRKVATGDSIRYDGIPENSVLWLRNLDEGKEERIFTMEDGKQIWW